MTITKKIACLALVCTALGGMLFGCTAARNQSDIPETGQLSSAGEAAAQAIRWLPTLVPPTIPPPTATPDTGLHTACLVGTWAVQDLQQVMADSFSNTHSTLTLETVEGEMLYQFTEDGWMTIQFHQFGANFSGEVDGLPVNAHQVLDGSATAQYQIDDTQDELVLTEFGGEGISAALDINEQRLAEGNLPAWQAFTSGLSNGADAVPTPLVAYARLAVECSPDKLTLQMIEPKSGAVFEFIKK